MRCLVVIFLTLAAFGASARMYQWVSPTSGSVESSGTPPAWYRAEGEGPRIQVFDNGQMVDDTAIVLPPGHSEKLREGAFDEFELRQQAEQVRRLERAARREAARAAEAEPAVDEAANTDGETTSAETPIDSVPDILDQGVIDRLKGLIENWDRQITGEK